MIYIKTTLFIFLQFFLNIYLLAQKSNLIPCQKGEYYCFCDSAERVVLNGKWAYVREFDRGLAFAQNKKHYGYIDSSGKWESNCSYIQIGRFYKGYAWATKKYEELLIIDKNCEVKFSKKHTNGECGAAFFDSIIVLYALNEMGEGGDYGAIDYNFKIVIPFNYYNMLKSSSDRYYLVSREDPKESESRWSSIWGIYDIVARKEIVPCFYKGALGGAVDYEQKKSIYGLRVEEGFLREMEKLNISLPESDEISEQINGIYRPLTQR